MIILWVSKRKEKSHYVICIDLNEMIKETRCIFEHLLNSGLLWAGRLAGAEDGRKIRLLNEGGYYRAGKIDLLLLCCSKPFFTIS
jgi:hypothetical protein